MPTESEIIRFIRSRARPTAGVVLGIGDDAAVLKVAEGKEVLACCDLLVEGVHFRREWCEPQLIGRKALAVNLSDIAAMGGVPKYAMASVALPGGSPREYIQSLFDGMLQLAETSGVALVGGDTSRSPGPIFIDVSVIGECATGHAITRSGARNGDLIFVTGMLGGSALGLRLLEQGLRPGDSRLSEAAKEAITRQLSPEPRLKLGGLLSAERMATAMIDISDGLSTDLGHIAEESRCGALIHAGSIPIADCVTTTARQEGGIEPLDLALHGGEEYELLFTSGRDNEQRILRLSGETGAKITVIGEITTGSGLSIERGGEIQPLVAEGYQHSV